jgi:xanthine dehydrogenase accessory factor
MTSPHQASAGHTAVWKFILNKMEAGIPVVLMYVLESHGSSPGRRGFHMAVAADHIFCGTIGGGIMEHKFVEMAKSNFEKSRSEKVFRQVHDKSADQQSGMICSGEQTIFVHPVQDSDLPHIRRLTESLLALRNGTLTLRPSGIHFSDEVPASEYYFESSGAEFLLSERTGYKNVLHVIGGGHCSLAFSRIMSDLDFFISVYDDRPGLVTIADNIYAHRKHILKDYSELSGLIQGGGNEYVVIMTFGYRTDDVAFRALWDKSFKYIGMLGSKKKIEKLLDDYRKEGVNEAYLANLVAPVGVPIKSETTTEIAISIAAQLIAVKNANQ